MTRKAGIFVDDPIPLDVQYGEDYTTSGVLVAFLAAAQTPGNNKEGQRE